MFRLRTIESWLNRCARFAIVGAALCSISSAQTRIDKSSGLGSCVYDPDASRASESCDEFALSSGFGTPVRIPSRRFWVQDQPLVSHPNAVTGYRLVKRFSIGGEGGWDYISIDSDARRLYVSHGTQLEVLDADSGKIIGTIPDTPGVHGAAIAPEFHRGFTSNGRDKTVTIFDTKTLATIAKVPLESGTDFILYDPFSKRVFPINEKITVIDADTGKAVGTANLDADPEAAVSDGKGTVYVNLADKKAVAVIDPKALSVTKTYPIENCTSPHSLSFDGATRKTGAAIVRQAPSNRSESSGLRDGPTVQTAEWVSRFS